MDLQALEVSEEDRAVQAQGAQAGGQSSLDALDDLAAAGTETALQIRTDFQGVPGRERAHLHQF